MNVADVRREYQREGLRRRDLAADPIPQFLAWLEEARAAQSEDFTSMTLATADGEGRPSARIVLLKGVDERGFVFYTNYDSRKGRELEDNPRAALVFYWPAFDRQVRVEGTVVRASKEESETYFRSRPLGSRLSAWVSPQSRVVPGRDELEGAVERARQSFADGDVPLPEAWGGYRVRHEFVEFWQGRENRLHDRLLYRRDSAAPDGWTIERLAP